MAGCPGRSSMTWVPATRNRVANSPRYRRSWPTPGMPEQVLDLDDIDVPDSRETGVTFAENALLKARAVVASQGCRRWPTTRGWRWTCSGSEGSRPGGAGVTGTTLGNLDLLLKQLSDVVTGKHRAARFVCGGGGGPEAGDGREVVELRTDRASDVRAARQQRLPATT